MSEIPPKSPAFAPGAEHEEPTYSKDYWDGVFEQIGKRKLVKLAAAVLALLYGAAIYAPLIASDRPLWLEAIDTKEYSQAQRTISNAVSGYTRLLAEGEAAFLANLSERAVERSFQGALASERGAVRGRIVVLERFLGPEDRAPLEALEKELDAFEALVAGGGPKDAVEKAQEALRERSRALRTELAPYDPEKPEAGGLVLRPTRSSPLLESITGKEVFFMVLWLALASWPLWNRIVNRVLLGGDRARIRRARRYKAGTVLLASTAAGLAWWLTVGGTMVFDASPFKQRLGSGEMTATRIVMPPIPMGLAETHVNERFRPPTWMAASEIDEQGYYVRGARAPRPDPVTGELPPPTQVEVRYAEPERNSAARYPLGADGLGRDLVTRLLHGARISLMVGLVSTTLLVLIGVVMGSLAGYAGGWIDIAISRIIEVFQSVPSFFLILVVVSVIDDDKLHPILAIIVVIGLVSWTGVARLVRGEFLKLKEQEFVVAARALGFSTPRIVFRHVLSNALGPVLVAASFSVAAGILIESAISFLGLGIKLPIPSWGSILNEARQPDFWWTQVFPGLLIFVTVFCYNLVGEGLRDALDPRMKT